MYEWSYKDDMYFGLSSFTKPSDAEQFDKLMNLDTGDTFIFFNNQWYPI